MKNIIATLAIYCIFGFGRDAVASSLPADSIYLIPPVMLENQNGERMLLSSLAGKPRLIGMFYGSCKIVCPLEFETVKNVEQQLVKKGKKSVAVLLISFDGTHDKGSHLLRVAQSHQMNLPLYQISRIEQGDVVLLGSVLGISWRALPEGGFAHNALLTLVDSQGRIIAQQSAQGGLDDKFLELLAKIED